MSLSVTDWVKLNRLLDEVLDLEPAQRARWMDALAPEYESLRETLSDLLFRKAALETSDVLRRASLFATEQFALSTSGDLVGPYRLIRQIGAGGMATVWLAERADGSLQRQVALKLPRVSWVDGDLAARLDRERDILASLEHPNIARLYDAGLDDAGRPFLALEYVDGIPLDRYASEAALSIPQRLALFLQVARAVAYAHAHVIVHRDLKPSNVLVKSNGEVRLLDFGIARLLQPDASAEINQSSFAPRALTPRYAAPEQFNSQAPTVATDIYSLGVILYELLCGRSPYPSRSTASGVVEIRKPFTQLLPILKAVDRRTARILRGDLEIILTKALRQDPQERYETVGAFIEDIQRYQNHLPVLARPDSAAYRTGKFVRRHRTAVLLGVALAIALAGGAMVSLWQASLALRERDRTVRMFQEAEATNQFWTMMLTETAGYREAISMSELLKRSEVAVDSAFADTPLQYAVAIDAIAELYESYGLSGKAETLLAKAIERTGGLESSNKEAASLQCSYAAALGSLGRTSEATAILLRATERVRDEPDLLQGCLQARSIIARDNNDATNALLYIQHAYRLSISSPAQSTQRSAQLLGDLAYAYVLNGEPARAQHYYEKSMRLFESLGREESYAAITVLNNWGALYIIGGNPAAALERYQRAERIAQKRTPDGHPPPYLLGNVGRALAAVGRFDEAQEKFEEMKERAATDRNARFATFAMANIAEVHLRRGDTERAQLALNAPGETSAYQQDRGPATVRSMVVQARIWAREGRLAQANGLLDEAIQVYRANTANVLGETMAFIARAELLLERGRFDEALLDAKRAIEIATRNRGVNRYSNWLGLALSVRGHIQLRQGDPTGARSSLRAAATNLLHTVGENHPDTRHAQKLLSDLG